MRAMPEPQSTRFDLVVIGGGINGAGIARDAAGRGAKVLLLEAGDLGSGTSSASTKLIHGGLRYLEHYEFRLVREALKERERLWASAPHVIQPLRFILPYRKGLRPKWLLRLGLFLYDHIGGRKALPPTRTLDLSKHPAGVPLRPGFSTAFEYSDCRVDDARLVVLNAMDAARLGAEVRTRTRVTAARRDGGGWLIGTTAGQFRADALINAAGPGVPAVLDILGEKGAYGVRQVRGSHIVTHRLFDHPFAYFFQNPDGRIFFAIPYEQDFTLVGTTDAEHSGSLDHVRASDEEVAYLCEGVSQYFAKRVTPADVVWSYAGVRALVDDGSGRPEAATRGYRLDLSQKEHGAPLLTVYGGKITTYRHLSEVAVNLLSQRLKCMTGMSWTDGEPLPGGNFPKQRLDLVIRNLRADYPFLVDSEAERIATTYGIKAYDWLASARVRGDLGPEFGFGLTGAEVDYLCRNEFAVTAEDVVWRRTKLGLHMKPEQIKKLSAYLEVRTSA